MSELNEKRVLEDAELIEAKKAKQDPEGAEMKMEVDEVKEDVETEPKSDAADASMQAGPDDEDTPLVRATKAAERAKNIVPSNLDPENPTMMPKHQQRFLLSAVKAIKRLKDASPFLAPVDPVKQGVPNYFDYIKKPMDLGTMETKLTNSEYVSVKEASSDFDLIVGNCIIFNGEDAQISKMALSIGQSFRKHLANIPPFDEPDAKKRRASCTVRDASVPVTAPGSAGSTPSAAPVPAGSGSAGAGAASAASASAGANSSAGSGSGATGTTKQMQSPGVPMIRRESTVDGRPKREIHPPKPRDLPYGETRPRNKKFAAELKFAGQVIRELMSRKHESLSYPFLLPVDPVAQGVPNYFEVIKEPMDLSTIQQKLNEGQYYQAEEFEADVRLMFRNAYTFNPSGTPVHEVGKKLEDVFDKRWIEKPQPAQTPPLMLSSDESDYEEEYEELGLSNPAIEILEEQAAMIQQQLRRLKRDAVIEWRDKRGKKKGRLGTTQRRQSHVGGHSHSHSHSQASTNSHSHNSHSSHNNHSHNSHSHSNAATPAPPSHSRKPSHIKSEVPQIITYEMKKELSEKISTLNEKRLRRVIAIIQESMPHLKNSGQEEIELDMDQLEPATLRELYIFVVRGKEPDSDKSSAAHSVGNNSLGAPAQAQASCLPQKKKKSKPLTEDEQNRQIEEIQNKLKQFDQAREGTPMGGLSPVVDTKVEDDSSSSDEGGDSDDSSSEEE